MPPLSLAGKHCAIVGATGILGASIAKAFANQGAVLTLLSRTILDARPRFEPELRRFEAPPDHPWQARPGHHRFLPLDVSSPQNIQSVFKHGVDTETKRVSETTVGPVDILVNCAGISQASLNKRTSDTELAEILNVNLLATMLACKHAKVDRQGNLVSSRYCTRLPERFKANRQRLYNQRIKSGGSKRQSGSGCLCCLKSWTSRYVLIAFICPLSS
jgi:3-oxoacyl-[acyl-carrier protein] reductase